MRIRKADVVIVGSGIAGLFTAKLLADKKRVIIVTKGELINSNSILAQGGIAAAIGVGDHWLNHFQDTIEAGNHHNNEQATELLVKNAPRIIQQLIDIGVSFDKDGNNNLELGQEGGHHERRIAHSGGDSTGKEIIHRLIEQVQDNITIYPNETSLSLLTDKEQCLGVVSKNAQEEIICYQAQHTILATGGIGGLYTITSNDKTITGDGIAMAYRAGAELVDLEFVQFHPTMLIENDLARGLVSEAVRGEGARLINEKGRYIMTGAHPLKDLAPRDIAARRIYGSIQTGDKIYLDISMIKNFTKRFPTISRLCEINNIDIKKGLVPIAPGAHFIMGGVKTNLSGETTIRGLYAIGETAYTGVHGANRLASNSLLEGILFANRVAEYIVNQPVKDLIKLPEPKIIKEKLLLPGLKQIQKVMSENAGIIRNKAGLIYAKNWLEQYLAPLDTNAIYDLSIDEITRLNMLTVGWLITTSALQRTESRGGHFRSDHPQQNDKKWLKQYIVRRRREADEPNQAKNAAAAAVR